MSSRIPKSHAYAQNFELPSVLILETQCTFFLHQDCKQAFSRVPVECCADFIRGECSGDRSLSEPYWVMTHLFAIPTHINTKCRLPPHERWHGCWPQLHFSLDIRSVKGIKALFWCWYDFKLSKKKQSRRKAYSSLEWSPNHSSDESDV